ncbi:MAG: hypothetical protein GY696_16340 [Gammaproteobacteria bacterium]|nr:hypothetical protein [Gammaproteobacteria bacterium]
MIRTAIEGARTELQLRRKTAGILSGTQDFLMDKRTQLLFNERVITVKISREWLLVENREITLGRENTVKTICKCGSFRLRIISSTAIRQKQGRAGLSADLANTATPPPFRFLSLLNSM